MKSTKYYLKFLGGASRPSGRTVAGKTKRKLERQESKTTRNNEDEKNNLSIGDKKKFFEEHNKVSY